MKRRYAAIFIIAAIFIPQMAGALPRPPATQTANETPVPDDPSHPSCGGHGISTVLANDSVGVCTPVLSNHRQYTFTVTGTWKPCGAPTFPACTFPANNADAAFETTDGTNWSHTNKGLVIFATNYGAPTSPITSVRLSDHKYTITWTGRGVAETIRLNDPSGYSDNTGSLTVKITTQAAVDYVYLFNQPLSAIPSSTPALQEVSVPLDAIPTQTYVPEPRHDAVSTPPIEGVPGVGSVQFIFTPDSGCGATRASIVVTVLGTPLPAVGLGCSFLYDGHPSTTTAVGGNTIPPQPLLPPGYFLCGEASVTPDGCPVDYHPAKDLVDCLDGNFVRAFLTGIQSKCPDNKFTLVPEDQGHPLPTFCLFSVCAPPPPGSSVELKLEWVADTTRLWYSFVNDDQGNGTGDEYVAPFNPFNADERAWFAGEVAGQRLGLTIKVTVRGPSGQGLFGTDPVTIPGLGQLIEASFATKVQGQ